MITKQKIYKPSPIFDMKVRDDDADVIFLIRDTLGFGKARFVFCGTPNRQVLFRADTIDECVSLVEVFDKYHLRAKKKREFVIWREAVFWWRDHRKMKVDRTPLMALANELSSLKKYATHPRP